MKTASVIIVFSALLALSTANAALLGTAFTYQGRLSAGTNAANGRFDLAFTLYDDSMPPRVVAGPVTNSSVAVSDGLFTVTLDFRADVFGAQARWLAIGVRPFGGRDFTTLSPRQHLTPTPQALYASDAGDALRLDGQLATAYAPAAGSTNYVAKAGDTMTGPLVVPANGFRAGTDQLVLTGGNVGIGTTSPGALLGLEGGQILAHARGSHSAGAWLSLENTSTDGKRWDFISTGAGNGGGAGNLLFRHAAVGSVLTLTPWGRAGVGTVSPIAKLDVVDEAGMDTLIRGESPRTTGSILALVNTDTGGKRWDIISTGSGNSGGAGNLLFREAGADPVLTLDPEGSVGVGTDDPRANLHLVGRAGTDVVLLSVEGSHGDGSWVSLENKQAGKRWHFCATGPWNNGGAGNLLFYEEYTGTEVMTLTPAGHVGVGTVNPTNRLQVVGGPNYGPQPVLRVNQLYGAVAQFHQSQQSSSNFIVCTTVIPPIGEAAMFRVNGFGDVYAQSYNPLSDRNAKENIAAIDPAEMLQKVVALPISKWNFRTDEAVSHVGPMAQDFHAAFGLGTDDKHIATVDADGVALAAIQGLNEKVESGKQKAESRMERLEAENAALEKEVAELKALVQTLAEKVDGGGQ